MSGSKFKTIYYNITKLLRSAIIANGALNPLIDQICHFEWHRSPSKQSQLSEVEFMHSCRVFEQWEGKRERQVMQPLLLLIKFIQLLIIFQVSFSCKLICWSSIGNFCQNFSRQVFFPLAMVVKMMAAWSAILCLQIFIYKEVIANWPIRVCTLIWSVYKSY